MKPNLKRRAKKARQKQRYTNWKQSGLTVSDCIQHFEIYGVFDKSPRVKLLSRRLATSAQEVQINIFQGLDFHRQRGTQLFVFERFDPDKSKKLKQLREIKLQKI